MLDIIKEKLILILIMFVFVFIPSYMNEKPIYRDAESIKLLLNKYYNEELDDEETLDYTKSKIIKLKMDTK